MESMECNPFYLSLQSRWRRAFEEAQELGCVFLVPSYESLQDVELTEEVLHTHVMRPSPYYKDQFVNLFGTKERVVEIDGHAIRRLSGFMETSDIEILYEEVGYTMTSRKFHIYVIASPLETLKTVHLEIPRKELEIPQSWLDGNGTASPSECKRILHSLCDGKALQKLESRTTLLLKNYLFLQEYLDDASKKIGEIIDQTVHEVTDEEPTLGSKTSSVLHSVVETYVMAMMYNHLFPIICQRFKERDSMLRDRILELHKLGVTPTHLGALEIFSCPIPASVVELARLDSLTSPREKVQCLKNAIDLVMAEVKQHLLETRGLVTPASGIPCLTTDDLIPVLLTAVIRSKLSHLASDLHFMDHFLWSVSSNDVYSYSLVTFKAVVEFLSTIDPSSLPAVPQNQGIKKELSLEELMKVTEELETKERRREGGEEATSANRTAVDRQMERITKMIEASTKALSAVQHHGVRPTFK